MGTKFNRGDLVRWCVGHRVYESDGVNLSGADAIYCHGIVMEVSGIDPHNIIVHSRDCRLAPRLVILNTTVDEIELLSSTEI